MLLNDNACLHFLDHEMPLYEMQKDKKRKFKIFHQGSQTEGLTRALLNEINKKGTCFKSFRLVMQPLKFVTSNLYEMKRNP